MILARYLLAQFFPPFLFGLSLFSGVLLLDKLFDLVDLLLNKGVSLQLSLRIFLLFLPTVLTLTVPMAVLLACLLTFGRLSEDHEITALRASGLSYRQILWPPLATAAVLSAAMVPFNATLAPRAMNSFRSLYHQIVTTDPLIKIEPRQFLSLRNIRLYADEVAADRRSLKRVVIYQMSPQHWQRIYARSGTVRVQSDAMTLKLEQGQMERVSYENPQNLWHIEFRDYSLSVPFGTAESSRDQSWREMSLARLREEIKNRQSLKIPAGPVEAEIHLRLAIAFSPLALAMLGIPLGIVLERGGRGVGFGASLAVVFLYYLLLIFGLNVAEKGALPALPALWLANAFTAVAGIILTRRRMLQ